MNDLLHTHLVTSTQLVSSVSFLFKFAVLVTSMAIVIYMMFQKPRLNTHRKKPFRKLVAEMATVENLVTDEPVCHVDDVAQSQLVDQQTNGLMYTVTDSDCSVPTSQT